MTEEFFIIRCGAAEAYLTRIIKAKKDNEADTYVYGTKEKAKAMRFTEAEARKICRERRAEMVRVKEDT